MFFKSFGYWSRRLLLFLMLGFSILGCSDYLKGHEKGSDPLVVKAEESECLQKLPGQFSDFLNDNLNPSDFHSAFTCLKSSIRSFARYTQGSSPDLYTDKELQHFINKYIFKLDKMDDETLETVMRLKVFAVGGSLRGFTRVEIQQTENYLGVLEDQFARLSGRMKLLLYQQAFHLVTEEDLLKTQQVLSLALQKIIFESSASGGVSGYEFADLQEVLVRFQRLFRSDRVANVLKWVPLARSIKNLYFGEHAYLNSRTEWKDAIDWTARAYIYGLRISYQLLHWNLSQSSGINASWQQMIHFGDESLQLLKSAPILRQGGLLKAAHLDQFIERIVEMNLLPKQWLGIDKEHKAEMIKSLYRKIVFHWLDQKKGEATDVIGIEERHLSVLNFEYQVWRNAQIVLNDLFSKQASYSNQQLLDILPLRLEDGQKSVQLRQAQKSWIGTFAQKSVPRFSSDLVLQLQFHRGGSIGEKQNFVGLSASNAIRMIVRFWMRGYGNANDSSASGSTERERDRDYFRYSMDEASLMELEFNFRDFGRAVGLLDSRVKGAAQRTFKEGNFFTASGNGDKWLTGQETYELLHFMFSGGLVLKKQLIRMADESHCRNANLDHRGLGKLKTACLKRVLMAQYTQWLVGAPGMANFVGRSIADGRFDEVFAILLEASKQNPSESEFIEEAELSTFASLLQYVESLFLLFDQDQTQGFSKSEIFMAETRFHGFLVKEESLVTKISIPEIFLYLLNRGQVPSFRWTQFSHFFADLRHWGSYLRDRTLADTRWSSFREADRLQVLRVIRVLKNEQGPTNMGQK